MAFFLVFSGVFAPFRSIKAASCVLQGNTITVSCEFDPGTYYYNGTFTVNAGVTVTAGNASSPGQVVIIADDFVIDGAINANGLGSAGGAGSCPGGGGTNNGGGACHGGDGGISAGSGTSGLGGSSPYGSVAAPSTLGSGGGDDVNTGGIQSGAGGGAVKIATWSATGTLAFGSAGSVTANGGNATSIEAGGGSGGSVWIDVGDLDIAEGTITANGGNASGSGTNGGGGGGGGRVSIVYSTTSGSFAQARQAYGGNRGTTTVRTAQPGGAGTLFVWDRDDANGALTLDANGQLDPPFTRVVAGSGDTFSALSLVNGARLLIPAGETMTVASGGTFSASGRQPALWIQGTFNAPSEQMTFSGVDIHQNGTLGGVKYLTFDSGLYGLEPSSALFSAGSGNRLESLVLSGTSSTTYSATGTGTLFIDAFQAKSNTFVTHATNTTAHAHSLAISATSSIEVQSGATIGLSGRGFSGGGCSAVGAGTGAGAIQSGGANGGDGGQGGATTSSTSSAYGSLTQPTTIGSGGGGHINCGSGVGGGGAGAVRLSAPSGTVTLNGTITGVGTNGSGTAGGGGAGGTAWIEASTVAGSGTINLRGGNGSGSTLTNAAGGGGGGRIAVHYANGDPSSWTLQAYGGASSGTGGFAGGAGTIFLDDTDDASPNGTLILDNNGQSGATSPPTETTSAFDSLTIRGGAKLGIKNGRTVTLPTGGAVSVGSGGARPGITIETGGALNANTANWAVEGFDVETSGTVTGPTQLSFKGARLKLRGGGRFFAPVTDLDFQTDSGLDLESEDPNLDLTDVTIPAGSTFNRIAGSTAPFGSNFQNLNVHGIYMDSSNGLPLFVDTLTVNSGALVTHATNTHPSVQTQRLVISATSTISVLAGGSVSTTGKGFEGTCSAGYGPGAGGNGGPGGSHGGNGAAGGGSTYGSVTAPITIGSSGSGHNGFCSNGYGGDGGGAIQLTAGGTVLVAGTVSANGTNGEGYSGGGSGGAIWISAGTLTGGGAITVNGGTGGFSGGGGGGGRIALTYATDSSTGSRQAYSAFGSAGTGGAGTIFLDDTDDASPNGTLVINNNNQSGAATSQATPNSQTYDSVDIRNGGNYTVPSGRTLTLASGGTLTGGGTTRGTLTVNSGGVFDPGAATFTFNQVNVTNAGTISTLTDLTVEGSTTTLSGTGSYGATLTGLSLRSSTFTQGSSNPGMNVTSLTMYASTYNNNSTNTGLNLSGMNLDSRSTFNNNSTAYYPLGSTFADLSITGTFVQNSTSTLFVDDLTVQSGGLLMHATNTSTTAQDKWLDVSATSSISVLAGGTISVNGRGFLGSCGGSGNGPGAPTSASRGGAYGGNGGGSGSGGNPYGSVTGPWQVGSTGSMGVGFCSNGTSGPGGGAVRLTTPGTLLAAGAITANSLVGTCYGGGSAGGSVWIDAGTLTGGGAITANGSAAAGCGATAGGAGGRIAIHYDIDSSTGTRTAYGGAGIFGGQYGGAGTVFIDDKDDALANGTLVVDNGNVSGANTTQAVTTTQTYDVIDVRGASNLVVPSGFTLATSSGGTLTGTGSTKGTLTINSGGTFDPGDATASATGVNVTNNGTVSTTTAFTFGNGTFLNNGTFSAGLTSLTVGSGANWRQQVSSQLFTGSDLTIENGGTFTQEHTNTIEVDTVTIESGGTLTHCDNTTAKTCEVDFSSTTFTVEAGGTINVDAKGFDATTGPGEGGDGSAGGGAGYGGDGGDGVVSSVSQNNNGVVYGSATGPVDLGSGGGDDTGTGGVQSGAGGGVIRLLITGTLTVDGAISADGQAGTANEGGGGSGGSIWLTVAVLDASANIGADGGAGSGNDTTGGGCGGGGRVAIDYDFGSYTQTATTTAAAGTGCTGSRTAVTGSVYLNEAPEDAPTINGITHAPSAPSVTDSVTISASATYALGLDRIELYLDGTTPSHLRRTCDFTAAVDGSCSIHVGLLSRGVHTTTVKAYGDDLSESVDAESFYVDGFTTVNEVGLSRLSTGATATFTLTYTLSGTSTQDLVVTFPGGFTVESAFTSGSGCLSNFGFTATTLTADTTDCIGTITASGATVTNPGTPGLYTIEWVDDEGEAIVAIVDDDQVNVSAEVDATITFNVGAQTAACDGTFTGNGGTAAFGTLTTSTVSTSDVSSVPHVCARLSSNAAGGAVVTVRSQYGALRSVADPSHEIPSSSATLVAGTEGYGLCVGSGGGDTGVDGLGASPDPQAPFDGSCATGSHAVGGLTTTPQAVWSIAGPAQNAFARLFLKAAISTTTPAHNDYTDVLTFIATGTF